MFQNIPPAYLSKFDSYLLPKMRDPKIGSKLIILLALPRSGSTLTYQLLVHSIRSTYLSNFWNTFYALPFIGAKFTHYKCLPHVSAFSSDYGFVSGACSPAEGLRFWEYWFDMGIDERIQNICSQKDTINKQKYINTVLSHITTPAMPMITGYLGHALHLDMLQKQFPDAIYVRLRRDPLSTAKSILEARRKSNVEEWFSVFPVECDKYLAEDIIGQVASQVFMLNRRMETDLKSSRVIDISFEDVCASPSTVVDKIINYCNNQGLNLERSAKIPDAFPVSLRSRDEDEDSFHLWRELDNLKNQYTDS
jgi:hypothetical protein